MTAASGFPSATGDAGPLRRRGTRRCRGPGLLLAAGVALVSACASGPASTPVAGLEGTVSVTMPGRQVAAILSVGGSDREVVWGLPAGPAIGLAVIQHGFSRQCRHLAGLLEVLVAQGIVTLCVDASMAGGHPALADALAELLVAGIATPDGAPLPERVIVGGHSAGAVFAARLGANLARLAPHRLAGALLFDPVAAGSFAADLRALAAQGARPVRTVSAAAGACNAGHSAYPALRAVQSEAAAAGRDTFVGLELTDRSTHVDAEGDNSDLLAWAACRQGRPQPANVQTLRALAAAWAADLLRGTRTPAIHPGGAGVEGLRAQGRAALIE
jgi:hypothetical protein